MSLLTVSTVILWMISLWLLLSVFRGGGVIRRLRHLVTAAVVASLGVLLGTLLLILHTCSAFSGETLVARVTTKRLAPGEFELAYAPAGGATATQRLRLRGDQWSISGGVVKWHPWLTAFGMKSYQQPMRLAGQFSNLEQQRSQAPTVYPLTPGADRLWEALYWADPYLPFVEAVYGSSAYVYVEPGVVQEVYVTPSGYLIKRAR